MGITRFAMFTNEELDAMESAFCNEGLTYLVDEIRTERRLREGRKRGILFKSLKGEEDGNVTN